MLLDKLGAGTLTLDGADTCTGGVTLVAGQLNINNAMALGSGTLTISGGILGNTSGLAITLSTSGLEKWNGDFAFAGTNNLNLGAGSVTLGSNRTVTVLSNNLTVGGAISGGFRLTKAGAGTLVLAGSDTYTGGTTVTGGLLDFATLSAIPTGAGSVTIQSGGAVLVGGAHTTVMGWLDSNDINAASPGALALTGTSGEAINMAGYANLSLGASGAATYNGILTPAATTWQLGGGGGTLTFASALTGSNSLAVSGPGMVVLTSANNTYNGGTTVASGTLDFSTPESMPSWGTLNIESGSEVVLGVLLGAAPSVAEGEPAMADVAADSSSPSAAEGRSENSSITALLARLRAVEAARDSAPPAVAACSAGATASASPASAPEPSTLVLLAAGVIGLVAWMRRRHRPFLAP